ncbi:FecR family protein [Parasphingorhabdus marina DSM 22363]|uniref:FecR family protein n=1 Tax=Parasphingorhabdus marina DSM 22363 TaxID=1123272 RepID=A0A1N6D2N1_9SPHN|nr:FecR domain-containing protein [Parasphingorhabdus marina]SIN65051.1 FecR family protein [Parasphingorhabdus marina DSM 22363]
MTSEPHMNDHNPSNDPIWEQAVRWVLQQQEDRMDVDDWEAFSAWLEQDPAHGQCYDQVVEADADLETMAAKNSGPETNPEPQVPANTKHKTPGAANDNRSWWAGFGAIAAVLIAAIVFWPGQSGPEYALMETAPGEVRTVAIGPSITMTMNGNSELAVNETGKTIRMISGEASFAVTSDIPGAIRVEVADLMLVDVGTVFNVIRDDGEMRLAVTDGAVMVNPDEQRIMVEAGTEIRMQLDNLSYTSRPVSSESVLAWQDGQLVFENRSLASVIADIERILATKITVPDELSGQRLTGTLNLANEEAVVMADLAAVLEGTARKNGDIWIISN